MCPFQQVCNYDYDLCLINNCISVGSGPFLNWVHENFDSFAAHHGDETMLGFLQEIPRSFVSPCPTRSPLSNMLNPIMSSTAVYPGTVNFPRFPNWNRPGLGNYCPPALQPLLYNTPPTNLHPFQAMSPFGNPFQIPATSLQAAGFPCNTAVNLNMPASFAPPSSGDVGVSNLTPLSRIKANTELKTADVEKGPGNIDRHVKVVSDAKLSKASKNHEAGDHKGIEVGSNNKVSVNKVETNCSESRSIVDNTNEFVKHHTSNDTVKSIGSKFESAFNSFVDGSTGSMCDAESCPGGINSDIVKFNVSKEAEMTEKKRKGTKKNV